MNKITKTRLRVTYGGVSGLVQHIEALKHDPDGLYADSFWDMVIAVLKDYDELKKENKKLKSELNDDSWPDCLSIGDRHEMGG